MYRRCVVINFLFSLVVSLTSFSAHARALPSLKITQVSVSGVSSGAFMAVQLGTAFSKTFMGVGSVAGGIFWCAEGDPKRSQTTCMNQPEGIRTSDQVKKAKDLASAGLIDPVEGVARQRVYVFQSPKDTVIFPLNAEKLVEFWKELGVGRGQGTKNLKVVTHVVAGHGFATVNKGNDCGVAMPPWMNKCNYDTAGEILRHFHGGLRPKVAMIPANLKKFSQAEFGDSKTPIHAEGWVYIPSACVKGESCRLHVALHGCLMNPDFIQDKFVNDAGYNEWAESNRIVVLYPQSAKLSPQNPYACWDWFGYTGQNYMEKSGAQMSAIKKMVEALGAK